MDWTELIRREIPDMDQRIGPYDIGEQQIGDDLIALFEQTLAEKTSALVAAHREGDEGGMDDAAHSIKGMGGMAGRPEISVLAEEMECRIRAGDRSGLARLVSVLLQCSSRESARAANPAIPSRQI